MASLKSFQACVPDRRLKKAIGIAWLSEDPQADLYGKQLQKLKKDKHYSFGNASYQLNGYRRDLTRAPFICGAWESISTHRERRSS